MCSVTIGQPSSHWLADVIRSCPSAASAAREVGGQSFALTAPALAAVADIKAAASGNAIVRRYDYGHARAIDRGMAAQIAVVAKCLKDLQQKGS